MRKMTRRIVLAAAALGLVVTATVQARAGVIIDTRGPGTDDATGLGSGFGLGSTITVGPTATSISNIEVNARIWTAGTSIDFLIFDHQTGALLYSQVKTFSDDLGTMSYRKSDDFSFVLAAGATYDIGATYTWSSGNSVMIGVDFTGNTQNGLTSSIPSTQFNGHSAVTNRWAWDPQIRLLGPEITAAPEPSTLAGGAIGVLMSLGYAWRRRRRAAA